MTPDTLLLIGGTMALMLAVAAFVLTQKNAWKAILLLVALFGGLNIGVFVWSEMVQGLNSFRLFLFWIAALLPPLLGLAIGSAVGAFVNWRVSKIKPSHGKSQRGKAKSEKTKPVSVRREKPVPKPRIID